MKGRKPRTKWVRVSEGEDEFYVCSGCEMMWFLAEGNPIQNEMYYCPRCGAKMDRNVYMIVGNAPKEGDGDQAE